ncbi:hypothetical protein ACJ2A9_04845 [Anaerobacillus sp. MEB173]|uniref:hypothetical protein n=1 Tax=Anaerobacillus sp. MEB173 TaxID=3383345 RepID=UPI003F926FF7
MRLPVGNINKLLVDAHEKDQEKVVWELWLSLYPSMVTQKIDFIEFDEFKKKLKQNATNQSNKSSEEIEDEMLKVVALYEKKK